MRSPSTSNATERGAYTPKIDPCLNHVGARLISGGVTSFHDDAQEHLSIAFGQGTQRIHHPHILIEGGSGDTRLISDIRHTDIGVSEQRLDLLNLPSIKLRLYSNFPASGSCGLETRIGPFPDRIPFKLR